VVVHPGLLIQGVERWSRLRASLPGVELAVVAVLPGCVCGNVVCVCGVGVTRTAFAWCVSAVWSCVDCLSSQTPSACVGPSIALVLFCLICLLVNVHTHYSMEQLTKEQRESLKKTNNERQCASLVKFEVDEELVFTSERDELLEMMAVQMLNRCRQKLLRCVCVNGIQGKS